MSGGEKLPNVGIDLGRLTGSFTATAVGLPGLKIVQKERDIV